MVAVLVLAGFLIYSFLQGGGRAVNYTVKPGADIRFLRPEITSQFARIDGVIAYRLGSDVVWWITSGRDGTHRDDSKHYKDQAIDIDVPGWTDMQRVLVAADLATSLGGDYDVVDEGTHIHIEFDP